MNRLVIEITDYGQLENEKGQCKKIFDDIFSINDEEKVSVKVFVKDLSVDNNHLSKKKEKHVLYLLKSGFSDEYIKQKMHIDDEDLNRIKNKI